MAAKNHRCFVIMPFSKTSTKHPTTYWDAHFKDFLKPLIEKCPNVSAYRSQPLRGDILNRIITDLVSVPIVVAELTDSNPNVFWELGVRQSFRHGTVTIAEEGTSLPFDVSTKGTLFYKASHLAYEKFGKVLKETILDCLENPDSPDSKVLETLSGRGSLYEVLHHQETARRLSGVHSEIMRNSQVYEDVVALAEENQKKEDKGDKKLKLKELPTQRFRIASVESLLVSRYLSEDDNFYDAAGAYHDTVFLLNDQLNAWEGDTKSTEQWFIDKREVFQKRLNRFAKEFSKAQKAYNNLI